MSLQYYILLEKEVEEANVISLYSAYRSEFKSKGLLELNSETITEAIEDEGEDPEWAKSYFDWYARTQIIINIDDDSVIGNEPLHELFEFLSYLLDNITHAVGFYVTGSIIYLERINSELFLHNYPEYWLDEYIEVLNQPFTILGRSN